MGDKGRVVLPKTFRNIIKEASGQRVLCLMKHPRWKCLSAFGLERKLTLEDQIDREERNAIDRGQDFDREMRAFQLFGFLEVGFDESGRFILPDHLARLANISDGIYFNGGGREFTLWAPEELSRMGAGWEAAQANCDSLIAETGSKSGGRK